MNIATRALFLAGALVLAHPLAIVLAYPWFPTGVRVEASIVLLASLVQPALGLLIVAAVAPLGELMFPLLGAQPPRHAETLVIAFLVAWLASRAFAREDGPALPRSLRFAVWIFAAVLAASVAATMVQYSRADPARFHDFWQSFKGAYLWSDDPMGVHAAMNLIEGMALMTATAWVVRRRPSYGAAVPIALVVGGMISAAATAALAREIAPAAILARQAAFGTGRYSAAMADLNAAGSYYLLVACVTVGIGVAVRRLRWPAAAAGVLLLYALMLTGSRAAFLAAAIAICGVVVLRALQGASARVKVALAVVAVAAVAVGAAILRSPSAGSSLDMRGGFTRASLDMIAARPVFGVGEGRYFYLSSLVLPPSLGWAYGQENAHDYFLQLIAELGLAGAAVFFWVLFGIFRGALRRPAAAEHRRLTLTFAVGAAAFLLTCLVGHPFLVAEAAFTFWIVAGLLVAVGQSEIDRTTPFHSAGAAIAIVAVLLTIPLRTGTPRIGLNENSDGLGPWRTGQIGVAYREAADYASVFVERTIDVVEIPVRAADEGAKAVVIAAALPGTAARDALLVGRNWGAFRIRRPPMDPLLPRWRVNLSVSRAPGEPAADVPRAYVGRVRIASTAPPPR